MGVTIADIAKKARVSLSTVSCALNNNPGVGKEKRERIFQIARELDFHHNIIAKGLALNKTHNIGIALYSVDYLIEPYFAIIVGGIARQVGLHDYNMQFTVTNKKDHESDRNLSFIRKIKQRCLDGLIIIDQVVSIKDILWLKERGVPFVLVDRFIPGKKVNCVKVDNEEGIFELTEYLIALGHKRVAFILETLRYSENFSKCLEMHRGYKQALSKHGLVEDRNLLVGMLDKTVRRREGCLTANKTSELRVEQVHFYVNQILALSKPPTAIMCGSDQITVNVLKVLKEKGIRVPGDIALTGYNDDPGFVHLEPTLTTVRTPLRAMGEYAAKMLFNLINDSKVTQPQIVLKPELVVRDSCGASKTT